MENFPNITLASDANLLVQDYWTNILVVIWAPFSIKACVQVGDSDPRVVGEKQDRLKTQKWLLLKMIDLKIFKPWLCGTGILNKNSFLFPKLQLQSATALKVSWISSKILLKYQVRDRFLERMTYMCSKLFSWWFP